MSKNVEVLAEFCDHIGSKTVSNTDRHADVDRQQSRDGTKGIGNSMHRMKSMSMVGMMMIALSSVAKNGMS